MMKKVVACVLMVCVWGGMIIAGAQTTHTLVVSDMSTTQTVEIKTIDLSKLSPEQIYWKGVAYMLGGELQKAALLFKNVVERAPKHGSARYQYARVLIRLNRIDEAFEHAQKSAELLPTNSSAHRTYGRALRLRGKREDAVKEFRLSCKLDPESAWSLNNLGLVLIELGRFEDARDALEKAVQLDATRYVMWNNLGIARYETGDTEGALKAFKKVLEFRPDHEYARTMVEFLE